MPGSHTCSTVGSTDQSRATSTAIDFVLSKHCARSGAAGKLTGMLVMICTVCAARATLQNILNSTI